MPRINHLALKVTDLEGATKFYENVFGFRQVGTGRSRGHISRHLTDGYVDLALMVDVYQARRRRPGNPPFRHRSRGPEELYREDRGQWRDPAVKAGFGNRQVPLAGRHDCRDRRCRPIPEDAGRRRVTQPAPPLASEIAAIPPARRSGGRGRACGRDRGSSCRPPARAPRRGACCRHWRRRGGRATPPPGRAASSDQR